MSFRRRGEVVSGRGPAPNNPMLNRAPNAPPVPRVIPNRMAGMGRPNLMASSCDTPGAPPAALAENLKRKEFKHPGMKPSIVLSNINCVSTGTKDIDTILIHGGLPVNTSLLIEEDGSTDFSGVLLKNYISEGIIQNRKGSKVVNHCIVVGLDNSFGNELPDVYAGNSKERKKKLVQENEDKLSVSNITNSSNDLKIAWRYRKDIQGKQSDAISIENDNSKYPDYNHQFDITTKIRPSPGSNEITYIPVMGSYDSILENIKMIIDKELKDESKMIRLAVPYFLNPMVYGCGDFIEYDQVIRFVFGLRCIINSYPGRLSMISTVSSELYEETELLNKLQDVMFDAVIRLVPFPHELNNLMEKVYKTQREKIKQGYVDIYRIPILSSLGIMERRLKEYSFKNSKSNFHVEQWSIPVEEEDVDEHKKTDF